MKIRFEPDDDLPLGKILSIPVTVITGSVFTAEVIMEGAFGEMFFRDIYSSVNGQWYRKNGKNLS